MTLFGRQFFKSKDRVSEQFYREGVQELQKHDFYSAVAKFRQTRSHASAYYNLSLIYGTGRVTPFDVDAAAEFSYKAAELDHPKAKSELFLLEAADRAGLGMDHLADLGRRSPVQHELPALVTVCGARFVAAVSQKFDVVDQVIAYELDAASNSELDYVIAFVERTGVAPTFYSGGMDRLEEGGAADQITDGLNKLYFSLMQAGLEERLCLLVRCTIIGYLVEKSRFGSRAKPLAGIDTFFDATPSASVVTEDHVVEDDYPANHDDVVDLMESAPAGVLAVTKLARDGNLACQKFLFDDAWLKFGTETDADALSKLPAVIETFGLLAARQGDSDVQFHLGLFYGRQGHLSGDDVDRKRDQMQKALFWIEEAAKNGHTKAADMMQSLPS